MSSSNQVILALPAYNEAAAITGLLEAAAETFAALANDKAAPYRGRVIVVDDGSKDDTAGVVRAYAARAAFPVEVVPHTVNKGLGQAILTSMRAALERCESEEDVIVNMDADNTHPPDVIPAMLRKLETGSDIVIASRYRPGSRQVGVPFNRKMMSWGARWLFKFRLNLPGVRDYTCGFRSYRARTIRRAFDIYGDKLITRQGFACTDEVLVNFARMQPLPVISEVPFILRYDRKEGASKLELWKTVRETLKMLWKH